MIKPQQFENLKARDFIGSGLRPTLLSLAIVQSLSSPITHAATISVTNFGDGGAGCTLRESIVSLTQQFVEDGCSYSGEFGENDKITIAAGSTVNLDSTLPSIIRSTIIESSSGGVATIVGGGDYSDGVFSIAGGADTAVTLDSLVISGGNAAQGGGINSFGSATTTLVDSLVTGNTANSGGGIYVDTQSKINLINSTVSGNTANRGGGIYVVGSTTVRLTNSSVSDNSATYDGGGVFIQGSGANALIATSSTISGNSAAEEGGGLIAIGLASNVSLSNSTLSGNFAAKGGGIYAIQQSSLSLTNTTMSENSATIAGGIYTKSYYSVSLKNSIVANSINGDCLGVVVGGNPEAGTVNADDHNIIEDGSCATLALNVDPLLGPLADNGGSSDSHLLLTGSSAINNGDNAVCAAAPINNVDQLGGIRPVDGVCDIGSVEYVFIDNPSSPESTYFVIPVKNGSTVIISL